MDYQKKKEVKMPKGKIVRNGSVLLRDIFQLTIHSQGFKITEVLTIA